MLYACLATFFCLIVGVTGIVLSFIDIDRFNFGLYLALLSVVGSTVSIAFWIIGPKACRNPACVQACLDKYTDKFDPLKRIRHKRRHEKMEKEKKSNVTTCAVEHSFVLHFAKKPRGDKKYRKQQKKSQPSVESTYVMLHEVGSSSTTRDVTVAIEERRRSSSRLQADPPSSSSSSSASSSSSCHSSSSSSASTPSVEAPVFLLPNEIPDSLLLIPYELPRRVVQSNSVGATEVSNSRVSLPIKLRSHSFV